MELILNSVSFYIGWGKFPSPLAMFSLFFTNMLFNSMIIHAICSQRQYDHWWIITCIWNKIRKKILLSSIAPFGTLELHLPLSGLYFHVAFGPFNWRSKISIAVVHFCWQIKSWIGSLNLTLLYWLHNCSIFSLEVYLWFKKFS